MSVSLVHLPDINYYDLYNVHILLKLRNA